jgi:hypothetical protein
MPPNDSSVGSYFPATFVAIAIALLAVWGCNGNATPLANNAAAVPPPDLCNNRPAITANQNFNRNGQAVTVRIFGDNTNEYTVEILDAADTTKLVQTFANVTGNGKDEPLTSILPSGQVPATMTMRVRHNAGNDLSLLMWSPPLKHTGNSNKNVLIGLVVNHCTGVAKGWTSDELKPLGISFPTPIGIALIER